MFEALVPPKARRPVRPLAVALVFHGSIVLGAVELRPAPVPPRPAARSLVAWLPPADAPAAASPDAGVSRGRVTLPAAPPLPAAPLAVGPGRPIGAFDVPARTASAMSALGREAGVPAPVALGSVLEAAIVLVAESSHPPELLDAQELERSLERPGLAGSATVRCVVDRAGRVIPGSMIVMDSTGAAVAAAARDALLRARYRPGRVGGVPADVEIRQRVTFDAGP